MSRYADTAGRCGRDEALGGLAFVGYNNRSTRFCDGELWVWQSRGRATECSGGCGCLFDKTPHAWAKAVEWTQRDGEYVKRAGFALMAALAVHDKNAPDARFEEFLPLMVRHATDERNFVKKAVNWALRQIGKRNARLNRLTICTARDIRRLDAKAARWIASDALRELTSDKVQARLTR